MSTPIGEETIFGQDRANYSMAFKYLSGDFTFTRLTCNIMLCATGTS